MVTAILPSLTDETGPAAENGPQLFQNAGPDVTLSVDSEATITPERFPSDAGSALPCEQPVDRNTKQKGKPYALAGYVGLFTGCGALVALSLFLPLPARFSHIEGATLGDAVKYSFYIVGTISFLVGIFVFFGLRGLRGEEGKGWRLLFGLRGSTPRGTGSDSSPAPKNVRTITITVVVRSLIIWQKVIPYWHLLKDSVRLGFTDSEIALGYLGGFVARASTVAISLFLPLFVNAFFIGHGFCQGSPNDPSPELKKECRQAYLLASILTGVAQLVGLICAPLFGYLSSRTGRVNWPIIVSTILGIVAYIAFPQLSSPEYKDVQGRGGSPAVFFLAALMGISQIGAIVCSLGSLGRGVLKVDIVNVLTTPDGDQETLIEPADSDDETAPFLENEAVLPEDTISRVRLKGSVAGVYSWCGGAAILLLTKLGGYLFDSWSTGAPFYLMAVFNGLLLIASIGIDVGRTTRSG